MWFNQKSLLVQVLVVVSLVASVTLGVTESPANNTDTNTTTVPEETTAAPKGEETTAAPELVEQTTAALEVEQTTAAPELVDQTTAASEVNETTAADGGGGATNVPQTENPGHGQSNVTGGSDGGGDAVTQSGSDQTEAPSVVTQKPDNGNTTSGSDSTRATPTYCYSCDHNSTDCHAERGASHKTCVSDDDICWMTFDLTTNKSMRSCDPLVAGESAPSCDDDYPSFKEANNVCEYCCKGNKCNTNKLTIDACSSATRVAWPSSSSLAVLLTIAAFMYSN